MEKKNPLLVLLCFLTSATSALIGCENQGAFITEDSQKTLRGIASKTSQDTVLASLSAIQRDLERAKDVDVSEEERTGLLHSAQEQMREMNSSVGNIFETQSAVLTGRYQSLNCVDQASSQFQGLSLNVQEQCKEITKRRGELIEWRAMTADPLDDIAQLTQMGSDLYNGDVQLDSVVKTVRSVTSLIDIVGQWSDLFD